MLTQASVQRSARLTRPRTPGHLWDYIYGFTGLSLAWRPVCPHHTPPFQILAEQFFDRPRLALVHGPRGAGKSLLSALETHLASQFGPGHGTRILGGSYQQSRQIYEAIRDYARDGHGPFGTCGDSIKRLKERECEYHNGSRIAVLAASSTSVRGPHVPSLRLDEVDEIKPDLRDQAMGMCMAMRGYSASVLMTSTWHRPAGPMAGLMAQAEAGAFPVRSFCVFDVIERCPAERSGPRVDGPDRYANCPACPIKKWCHEQIDQLGEPKAKLADGHYAIDSLIAKVHGVSDQAFEADYLCRRPRVDGLWFPSFSAANISVEAEYKPGLPVWLPVDSGVHTGGVWFQTLERTWAGVTQTVVHVFAEYYHEISATGGGAFDNARRILEVCQQRCAGRRDHTVTDPAGKARNEIGSTVLGEYERAGLKPIRHWGHHQVADGLALIESFLRNPDGTVGLLIHPRCTRLIQAFQGYARAKSAGVYLDYPQDPQHPHEDLMDSLRGGLMARFPNGRRPEPNFPRLPLSRIL